MHLTAVKVAFVVAAATTAAAAATAITVVIPLRNIEDLLRMASQLTGLHFIEHTVAK